MNAFPGLNWESGKLFTSVYFVDMTVSINDQNHIESTLFDINSIYIFTFLYILTPPPPPKLSTAPCFKFLPFVLMMMINKSACMMFFQMSGCPSIVKAMKSKVSAAVDLLVLLPTLDPQLSHNMNTTKSFSTYHFIHMTMQPTGSRKHGAPTLINCNGK